MFPFLMLYSDAHQALLSLPLRLLRFLHFRSSNIREVSDCVAFRCGGWAPGPPSHVTVDLDDKREKKTENGCLECNPLRQGSNAHLAIAVVIGCGDGQCLRDSSSAAWRLVSSHGCRSGALELDCLALAVAELAFVAAEPWLDLCTRLEVQAELAVVAARVPWIAVVCRYWPTTF